MAKGADLGVGGCPPPHTLFISLSRDLIDRSWSWSEAWHAAFELALQQLCDEVVAHILNGHAITPQPNAMPLPAGCIEFCVRCSGTRIVIAVLGFVGPHDPGPNGGTWQPRPTCDRVLGVYGSGKEFSFVTFDGPFYGPLIPERLLDALRQLRQSASQTRMPYPRAPIVCSAGNAAPLRS